MTPPPFIWWLGHWSVGWDNHCKLFGPWRHRFGGSGLLAKAAFLATDASSLAAKDVILIVIAGANILVVDFDGPVTEPLTTILIVKPLILVVYFYLSHQTS